MAKRKRKRVAHNRNAPGRPATDRQSDVQAAVATHLARTGEAPSAGDVAAALGISRQGALKQLKALEAKGLVRDKPRKVRSGKWELTEESIDARSARTEQHEQDHPEETLM